MEVAFPRYAALIGSLYCFGLAQIDPDALARVDRTPTQLQVVPSIPERKMPVPHGAVSFKRLIRITGFPGGFQKTLCGDLYNGGPKIVSCKIRTV